MFTPRVTALLRTAFVTALAAGTLAVAAPGANASGASGGSLVCTFTVSGHYRSAVTIDSAYLERLGVPADEAPQVMDNLAAKARTFPADWNVHCVPQGNFGPPLKPSVGGHPSTSAPYISCEMNNVTPSADTTFSFDEGFLQYMGIRPSAWPTVLSHLSSIAASLPSSWGVSCTTQNAGNPY